MKKINKKRFLLCIAIFISLFGYYFLVRYNIFAFHCPTKYFFGIYCPGCGVSRMLIAISKFQWKQAFYYNRLFFILLPFLFILIIDGILGYVLNRKYVIINKIPLWVYILVAIIIIFFGILRNTDSFYYLRPIHID